MTDIEVHDTPTAVLAFDDQTRQLVADSIAPGASPMEIEVFLLFCEHVQLDPYRNQVWLVPRYDSTLRRKVFKPQVGIDGMRLIAERSKLYAGSGDPEWCDDDGNWRDVWLDKKPPAAARARVYRSDWAKPSVGVATWDQFAVMVGKPGEKRLAPMWQQMGPHMLFKCAEAQALRRAFPAEMAGLYTDVEMGTVDHAPEPVTLEVVDEGVSAVLKRITPLAQRMDDVDKFKAEVNQLCVDKGLGEVSKFAATGMTLAQAELAEEYALMITATAEALSAPDAGLLVEFAAAHNLEHADIDAVCDMLGVDVAAATAHVAEWGAQ